MSKKSTGGSIIATFLLLKSGDNLHKHGTFLPCSVDKIIVEISFKTMLFYFQNA